MGGESSVPSLCVDETLRLKLAGLAEPRLTLDDQDLAALYQIFPFRPADLSSFRFQLTQPEPLSPQAIRDTFIVPLQSIATNRLGRKNGYGLFVALFGEGNWSDCFPNLATQKKAVEEETLAALKARKIPAHIDGNTLVNGWLADVGSAFRCFQWDEGTQQGFICGEADEKRGKGYTRLRFKTVTATGCFPTTPCPDIKAGYFDGRQTVGIFLPPLYTMLRSRQVPNHLFEAAAGFVERHETAHTEESYRVNRLIRVATADLGWKEEGAFHCTVRESLADFAALPELAPDAQLVYGALRLTHPQIESDCAPAPFTPATAQLFSDYIRELTALINKELAPYDTDTLPQSEPEKSHAMVRLYLEKNQGAPAIQKLIRRWRQRFTLSHTKLE